MHFSLFTFSFSLNFMATKITQIEDAARGKTILRVEGSMTGEDAALIEKIALDLRGESDANLTIDLADLNFLDSDAASILRRIEERGFEIEGLMIFLQKAIEEIEKRAARAK